MKSEFTCLLLGLIFALSTVDCDHGSAQLSNTPVKLKRSDYTSSRDRIRAGKVKKMGRGQLLSDLKENFLGKPELLDELTKQLTVEDLNHVQQMEENFEASLRCLKVAPNESPLEKLGIDEKSLPKDLIEQVESAQQAPELVQEPMEVAGDIVEMVQFDGSAIESTLSEQQEAQLEAEVGTDPVLIGAQLAARNFPLGKCIDVFGLVGQRVSNVIDGRILDAKKSILLAGRFLRWYSQYKSLPDWERQVAAHSISPNLSIANTIRIAFARVDSELSQKECPGRDDECDNFAYIMRVLERTINDLEADVRVYYEKNGQEFVLLELEDEDDDEEGDLPLVAGPEVDLHKSMDRLRKVMTAISKRRLQAESKIIVNLTVQAAVFWALSSTMTNVIGVDQDTQIKFMNIARLLVQTDFKRIAPSYFFGMRMRPIIQLVTSFFR